jgi:hypothetical protein
MSFAEIARRDKTLLRNSYPVFILFSAVADQKQILATDKNRMETDKTETKSPSVADFAG